MIHYLPSFTTKGDLSIVRPKQYSVSLTDDNVTLLKSILRKRSTNDTLANRCRILLDSEYVRNGTCSIFAFVKPLCGRHHVCALQHRTANDWVRQIKYLVDVMYPDVEKIILVIDNLNTHTPSSLYKTFAPQEANRI